MIREVTGSTNDDVKQAALDGAASGYTVVADRQTAGRGRRGRVWESPSQKNLYVSVLVRHGLTLDTAPLLTLTAGLAIARCCELHVDRPSDVRIKWPNDVKLNEKKVAGVLVEASIRASSPTLQSAVIGVGLNVCEQEFGGELRDRATWLAAASTKPLRRSDVLRTMLTELELQLDRLLSGKLLRILDDVRARCETVGQRILVDGQPGPVHVLAIADDGALQVQDERGVLHAVRSGEVLEQWVRSL